MSGVEPLPLVFLEKKSGGRRRCWSLGGEPLTLVLKKTSGGRCQGRSLKGEPLPPVWLDKMPGVHRWGWWLGVSRCPSVVAEDAGSSSVRSITWGWAIASSVVGEDAGSPSARLMTRGQTVPTSVVGEDTGRLSAWLMTRGALPLVLLGEDTRWSSAWLMTWGEPLPQCCWSGHREVIGKVDDKGVSRCPLSYTPSSSYAPSPVLLGTFSNRCSGDQDSVVQGASRGPSPCAAWMPSSRSRGPTRSPRVALLSAGHSQVWRYKVYRARFAFLLRSS